MINHGWKKFWLFAVMVLSIFLCGCINLEIDLAVNRDSSGRAKIIAAAPDPMLNEIVDGFIRQIRTEYPQARISEIYVNNKKVAKVEISFNNVTELSGHDFLISHYREDQKHRIEIEVSKAMPMKISLTMPGKITDSNGTFTGSTARWEATFWGGTYWAESEETIGGGATVALVIVLFVIAGFIIWYFRSRRASFSGRTTEAVGLREEPRGGWCSSCGSRLPPSDKFCSRCGSKRDS